ncbi:MAG: hypothetical protein AOA66_0960 [Candidatus Bathyarchaeota archaeon BA2]|nr:MAG: hypothetical protein AOA66_0960 [Candidatus Bathyarchaeota archaeon BA2]
MPTVVLEKMYGSFSPEAFESVLLSLCKGLKVRLRVVGKTSRGWIQTEVSGEDETAALHFIDREIGLAPVSVDKLKKFSVIRGRVVFSGKSKNELFVDVGVFSPETYDAVVPLQTLQVQLADGIKLPLQRLIELFCLYDNLPLKVKVAGSVNTQKKLVEAELSEAQLSQITHWIRSRLDRLLVLGAPFSDVEHAVRASRHFRDVVKIEPLGLLEQAILCKLGTDAKGLIPKLGRLLPDAMLAPFCPRKIRELTDRPFL